MICQYYLKKWKGALGHLKIDWEKTRNCPMKPKLSYGIASASTRSSPCSIPILCSLCPKPEPAVWRYNAKYHFGLAHPNADPQKYNHLWHISNFEIQEMKKKWVDCHHVAVKQARKSKSAPLVIYDAHRSQISTNREVSSNCNSLKSSRNLKCPQQRQGTCKGVRRRQGGQWQKIERGW